MFDIDEYFDHVFKSFMKDMPIMNAYRVTLKNGVPSYEDLSKPSKQKNIDEIVTDDEIKFVFEMAGLEKKDIKIDIEGDLLKIHGEHGERKYHEQVALKYKVEKTPKATYKNGILEIIFKREKTETTKVQVE